MGFQPWYAVQTCTAQIWNLARCPLNWGMKAGQHVVQLCTWFAADHRRAGLGLTLCGVGVAVLYCLDYLDSSGIYIDVMEKVSWTGIDQAVISGRVCLKTA